MKIDGIDHVNIRTPDVPSTAKFFADVLGMEVTVTDMHQDVSRGCWVRDSAGTPIIHVGSEKMYGPQPGGVEFGAPANSGRIHHVALRCSGFAQTEDRLRGLGVDFRVNDRKYGDLRQIFVTDPNGIQLELNFAAD